MDIMDLFEEYAKRFGDGFPMIPLGWGRSDDEVAEMIKKCLKAGKDAYQMGYLKDDAGVIY